MMLIIYSRMALGGIETFYLRLAKARNQAGLKTRFLLISKRKNNDQALLSELMVVSEVFFFEDFIHGSIWRRMPLRAMLLFKLKKDLVDRLLNGVSYAHTSSSIYVLLFSKLLQISKKKIGITIGVYHSKEFTWEYGGLIPYFEKINRKVFSYLIKNNSVIFFNDKLPAYYKKEYSFDEQSCIVFPLGVVEDESPPPITHKPSNELRIASVGRLVKFKTYNSWMLDVVRDLSKIIKIKYDIYGDGPLREELEKKAVAIGVDEIVSFKGSIPYHEFGETLSKYNIFVGSGTAIIEAASMGIPAIVGIESSQEAMSYGFVGDLPGFSYNEDGLYEKTSVFELLSSYQSMDQKAISDLRCKHKTWASQFSMGNCVRNFENIGLKYKTPSYKAINLVESVAYAISGIIIIFKHRFLKRVEFDQYS